MDELNYVPLNGRPMKITWKDVEERRKVTTNFGSVFIKNLDKNINERQLFRNVKEFGSVLNIKVNFVLVNFLQLLFIKYI